MAAELWLEGRFSGATDPKTTDPKTTVTYEPMAPWVTIINVDVTDASGHQWLISPGSSWPAVRVRPWLRGLYLSLRGLYRWFRRRFRRRT